MLACTSRLEEIGTSERSSTTRAEELEYSRRTCHTHSSERESGDESGMNSGRQRNATCAGRVANCVGGVAVRELHVLQCSVGTPRVVDAVGRCDNSEQPTTLIHVRRYARQQIVRTTVTRRCQGQRGHTGGIVDVGLRASGGGAGEDAVSGCERAEDGNGPRAVEAAGRRGWQCSRTGRWWVGRGRGRRGGSRTAITMRGLLRRRVEWWPSWPRRCGRANKCKVYAGREMDGVDCVVPPSSPVRATCAGGGQVSSDG